MRVIGNTRELKFFNNLDFDPYFVRFVNLINPMISISQTSGINPLIQSNPYEEGKYNRKIDYTIDGAIKLRLKKDIFENDPNDNTGSVSF